MRRRTADLLLLAPVLALWTTCAVLHLRQVVHGRLAWVPVYVDTPASAVEHPRVRGFWPGTNADDAGGLHVGDRLLRVGDEPLAGVGPVGFFGRVHEVATRDLAVPVAYERDGAHAETRLRLVPAAFPWRMLPLACALVVTAALVLLRRGETAVARAFFLGATAFATHWTFFFGGPRAQTYAWLVVFAASSLVMLPLVLRAALAFPPEVATARPARWPWAFAVFGPLAVGWVLGVPIAPEAAVRGAFAVNVAFIAAFLAVLTRNYRRSGPIGRRQLKWVMLGMYLGLVPVLLADAVVAVDPALWWLHEATAMAEVVIPAFILIAIVRENLFDIDQLITRAAVWTLLSIAALAAALFALPHVARLVSSASGFEPQIVQPVLSLAMAAGIVPGARMLEPRLERVLFRERYAFRAGVEGLLRELSTSEDRDALFAAACARLDAVLRPHGCAIYATADGDLLPAVAAGVADEEVVLPVLAAASPLRAALDRLTAPLDVARWLRARPDGEHGVDTLDAAVIVPVRPGGELEAAILLGAKRSGDVYTPTDLALLAAVGDKLAGELMRIDTGLRLRAERDMREAFRRYVPAPVAARLTRGQAVEGGEREVSVLFVDIRGYTTLSEGRGAGAVFSLVNRYTEAVSAAIQRRGGTVVEFLGDGLMAVFGAPEVLPRHAHAAVEAAREVAATVRAIALAPDDSRPGGSVPIAVGVGVASGRAFVGNVRTNDRLVYTAIGDVVNLASRIERLTRELDAAVAIDARTHRDAGPASHGFRKHPGVPIRGRAEAVDVWTLPLAAA